MHSIQSAYLMPKGLEAEVRQEIIQDVSSKVLTLGQLLLSSEPAIPSIWAQNIWKNISVIRFESISEGIKIIKSQQMMLWPYYSNFPRRMKLIYEKVPSFKFKRLEFNQEYSFKPLGAFTLLDEHHLIISKDCESFIPNGEWEFNEDKENPPSRAYLKLWEVFSRFNFKPQKDDKVLELGGSPGGWAYVLSKLSKEVHSYDRSPIDAKILQQNPNIHSYIKDVFTLKADDFKDFKWLFCDVACYPEKLLEWLTPWLKLDINLVCTLKIQGLSDPKLIEQFKSIKNAQVLHLYHNKHELTFIRRV